jgi:hypothetical protein
MTVDEFYQAVIRQQARFFPNSRMNILKRLTDYIQLRITLTEELSIAVRYNAENGRQDFALIYQGRRIFGYDNLKRWHYHPFENPEKHIPCPKPSVGRVFREISELVQSKHLNKSARRTR